MTDTQIRIAVIVCSAILLVFAAMVAKHFRNDVKAEEENDNGKRAEEIKEEQLSEEDKDLIDEYYKSMR
jgi:uncharacterized membrane protein